MECEFAPRGAYVCDARAVARCQGCHDAFCRRHIRRCPVCFIDICAHCNEGHVCNFGV